MFSDMSLIFSYLSLKKLVADRDLNHLFPLQPPRQLPSLFNDSECFNGEEVSEEVTMLMHAKRLHQLQFLREVAHSFAGGNLNVLKDLWSEKPSGGIWFTGKPFQSIFTCNRGWNSLFLISPRLACMQGHSDGNLQL